MRKAHIPLQLLGKLKFVNLTDIPKLEYFIEMRVPFLHDTYKLDPISLFSVLEHLTFTNIGIKIVSLSISCLSSLAYLTLEGCTMLKSISRRICKLKNIKNLSLIGCQKLESFPKILEPL